MSYNTSDLISELKSIISEIEEELTHRIGITHRDNNINQLEYIRDELIQILESAEIDKIPEKTKRYTAFSRYVTDEWPLNAALGEKLCILAYRYKRL